MLFNSSDFVVFFLWVGALYGLLRRHYRSQNLLLLVASYVFYGYWNVKFCILLLGMTALTFGGGWLVGAVDDPVRRRRLTQLTVGLALGLLGFFKYYNFFVDSGLALFEQLGLNLPEPALRVLLPVGISFYTFHGISYVVDINRQRITPTRDFVAYALFIAFFPLLVAGPIERATNLLPQVQRPRRITWEQIDTALYLLILGYFKKSVVADRLAPDVNMVYGQLGAFGSLDLTLATLAFTFQIYADFSGYTDIARGIAKLLGFDLMLNFRLPYFAANPSDFWARWHISLSSWLRDYLYITLGGNRHGRAKTYRNLLLTMLLGGLWHGAAWHFVLWGAYHGSLLVAYRIWEERFGPSRPERWRLAGSRLLMFGLTVVGWILFRAESAPQSWYVLTHLGWQPSEHSAELARNLVWFAWPLLLHDWLAHRRGDLQPLLRWPFLPRAAVYTALVVWTILYAAGRQTEFIYFQF